MSQATWSVLFVASLAVTATALEIPTNALSLLSATNRSEPTKVLQATQERLRGQFNRWLKQPGEYAKKAVSECSVFPEGEVYPYALPAMAYCNLARSNSRLKTDALANVPRLLELLIVATGKRIGPPRGDLMQLTNYAKHGTFLATLNTALGHYRLIASNDNYAALHGHISHLLYQAVERLDGKPIESYPEYTWYFDSIMALASLRLFEQVNHLPPRSDALLRKHLRWRERHGHDKSSGLPIAYTGGLPRGCDVSMQICLLAQMDHSYARKLYDAFADHHWADYGIVAGFTEWPRGRNLFMTGDIDSGPLFLGIGMTATGVGIGAALAMADSERVARLAGELANLPKFVSALAPANGPSVALFDGIVPINSDYLTGFLYGDVVLFYAVTCTSDAR